MSVYPKDAQVVRSAVISEDGLYRYSLTRAWFQRLLPFVMLNPSTADAEEDDPTIRRCVSFADREGYEGIFVVNLYAYRATKPQALWAAKADGVDIVGPDNDRWLLDVFSAAEHNQTPVVAAWGVNAKPERVEQVLSLPGARNVLHHFGLTSAGHPRHPLMLPSDATLRPWSPTVTAEPAAEPVDPWTGHSHPQDADCPALCPKFSPPDQPDPEPVTEPVAEAVERVAAKKTTRARGNNRASGKPAATEEGEKSADEATSDVEEKVLDVEREEWFRAPGFQRMKTAWEGDDKRQMDRVQGMIDRVVLETFQDAYAVMSDIYDLVREEEVDETTGETRLDPLGFKIWKRNPLTGAYYEDWSLLSIREREHFLFRITTALFDWEQRAADLWTRAMFSKGMFVEKFSIEYDAPMHGTIDDRNARGNKEAAEDRYFALMNSAISRKADALVRTMTNLQLRLKDTLGQ